MKAQNPTSRRSPEALTAERRANAILDRFGILGPKDLVENLEPLAIELGAFVQYKPIQGAEARIVIVGSGATITISTHVTDPGRRRFSIAHELGHFELHRQIKAISVCSPQDLDDWQTKTMALSREQQANEFASALLLPARFVARDCQDTDPSLEVISQIASTFGVSVTAAGRRYVGLSPFSCAIVFVKDGSIAWFQGSNSFLEQGYFVDVHAKALLKRASSQAKTTLSAAQKPVRVSADEWLKPGNYNRNMALMAQTLWMPNYGASLTLLSTIDDEDDYADDFD